MSQCSAYFFIPRCLFDLRQHSPKQEKCPGLNGQPRVGENAGEENSPSIQGGCLPGYAVLREGRPHPLRVACALAFPSGALVAMDRGEVEYAFFDSLNERGVVLVPRLQDKALGEVAAVVAEPQGVILPTRGSICRGTGKHRHDF